MLCLLSKEMQSSEARSRNLLGFACLGVLNNIVFIVSNASANAVVPDAIALVYIVNTAPGLVVKLAAPLWIDRGSYDVKILAVGGSLALNLLVARPRSVEACEQSDARAGFASGPYLWAVRFELELCSPIIQYR